MRQIKHPEVFRFCAIPQVIAAKYQCAVNLKYGAFLSWVRSFLDGVSVLFSNVYEYYPTAFAAYITKRVLAHISHKKIIYLPSVQQHLLQHGMTSHFLSQLLTCGGTR